MRQAFDAPWSHRLTRRFAGAAVLAVTAALAAPAHADRRGQAADSWQMVGNLGTVLGADGRLHSAACTGFPGTDPGFKFWSRRTDSKNLVVFFEGGGACWDDLTCTFPAAIDIPPTVPQFFTPSIGPDQDPTIFGGIFDLSNAANPVRDWNFVYIPYCTGDLHTGSADRTYRSVVPPPRPFAIHHGGFDNFMVVLDWMKKNLRAPEQVLVTGVSAGGYGAAINFPWVQTTFPKARMAVLTDGSQGVTTPGFDFGLPGRNSWIPQLAPTVPGADPATLRSSDYLRVAALAYPRARIAQVTTRFDEVQIGFYGVMKENYGPGGACPDLALDWNGQMLASLASYVADVPNFRHYVAEGSYHTILESPTFYTESSAGVPLRSWLAAMLDRGDDRRSDGVGWTNRACPGCLIAPPCP